MEDQAKEVPTNGVVSAIVPEKGFGFIVADGEEGEYFFHSTAVTGEFEDLAPGDKVTFSKVTTGKGKRAVGVARRS